MTRRYRIEKVKAKEAPIESFIRSNVVSSAKIGANTVSSHKITFAAPGQKVRLIAQQYWTCSGCNYQYTQQSYVDNHNTVVNPSPQMVVNHLRSHTCPTFNTMPNPPCWIYSIVFAQP